MKALSIAVIDDGINEHAICDLGPMKHNIEIQDDLKIIDRINYDSYILNHSTICSSIIKKYSPTAQLSSIKVLDNKKKYKGTVNQLKKALIWCAENNIKIVNLSLGSSYFKDYNEIQQCINEVTESGLIIIGAYNNDNIYTLPACLSNVIGVKSNTNYQYNEYEFNILPENGVNISASGIHKVRLNNGNHFKTENYNSFAAPVISSKVYEILKKNPDLSFEEINLELFKESMNYNKTEYYNPYLQVNTDWMNINTQIRELKIIDETCSFDGKMNGNQVFVAKSSSYSLGFFLGRNYSHIRNLIYISEKKLSDEDYLFLTSKAKMKIWNNLYYENFLNAIINKQKSDIDIPVLAVCGLLNNEALRKISNLFYQHGYYAIIVSNQAIDVLLGYEYLPKSIIPGNFFAYIYEKYNCDIIIFRADSLASYPNNVYKFDIYINVLENNLKLNKNKNLRDGSVSIDINKKQIEKKIKKVYKFIKKILE